MAWSNRKLHDVATEIVNAGTGDPPRLTPFNEPT
jgi:hypothetical protein